MPVPDETIRRNRLLAAAPADVLERLAGVSRSEQLTFKEVLFEHDTRIDHVVFPVDGVCSLLSVGADDRIIEVATIGNEGFVGLPVFLQASLMSAHRTIVQVPGDGVVVPAAEFLEISNSGGPFQAVLMRYTQALMTQIAQAAACNRLHSVELRCARWLAMTDDRVEGETFELTQEFLGQMLGVGRQAVNEAAQALQDRGLISYARGVVVVRDRDGLRAAACDCYGIIRREFDRLLPDGA